MSDLRLDLLATISDLHKDLYGFRPHGTFNHLPVVELEEVLSNLSKSLEMMLGSDEYKVQEEADRAYFAEQEAQYEYDCRLVNEMNAEAADEAEQLAGAYPYGEYEFIESISRKYRG
jgi:hypothetical protein